MTSSRYETIPIYNLPGFRARPTTSLSLQLYEFLYLSVVFRTASLEKIQFETINLISCFFIHYQQFEINGFNYIFLFDFQKTNLILIPKRL